MALPATLKGPHNLMDHSSPEGGAILRIKNKIVLISLLLVSLVVSSCNMPQGNLSSAEETAIINTSVAETVAAGLEVSPQPNDTESVDPTVTPDPNSEVTNTPEPSDTPEPDTPTPSNTPIPCKNLAAKKCRVMRLDIRVRYCVFGW